MLQQNVAQASITNVVKTLINSIRKIEQETLSCLVCVNQYYFIMHMQYIALPITRQSHGSITAHKEYLLTLYSTNRVLKIAKTNTSNASMGVLRDNVMHCDGMYG